MNNKSVRLQILQYLHEYFNIKNKNAVKKGRKVKSPADILKDLQGFCSLVKKEVVDLRKDLKEKIDFLQRSDEKKMQQILEDLEGYSNANEEVVIMSLIRLFEDFTRENDKQKKKEILIKIEDFVYEIASNEKVEVSWDLFTFLNECFFIYYNHNEHKADIEYGLDPKEDKQIEMSVSEKLSFLKDVVQG
jgi:hypothetical protein